MVDEPQAKVHPKGLEGEFPHGPPTVVLTHQGFELVLRFAPGDFAGEGDVQEIRLLPAEDPLKATVLKRLMPNAELYFAFARSTMRILGPEGTPASRIEDWRGAAAPLRDLAGPGRGHQPEFYRTIARHYEALVTEGQPHPIKAIAEKHFVTISAASRWVTEARRRGYLPPSSGGQDRSSATE